MTSTVADPYIRTAERLREVITAPPPESPAVRKEMPQLDRFCRAFIERCPFLLLGTSGREGRCDVSPKGDSPGFVVVLDDNTLAIPDRPGNRRIDSLLNIIENPHAGLIFIVPNVDETLRVNGRAMLSEDPDLLDQMTMRGKTPKLAIVVEIEEVFFHCARAFKRAKLWDTDTWIEREELPTLGEILAGEINPDGMTAADLDERLSESNKRLY